MENNIIIEQIGSIKKLEIHRPEKKNALTQAMYTELTNQFKAAESDSKTRCILICGVDEVFTSGNDVKDFIQPPKDFMDSPVAQFLKALAEFQKPLIAAVNGPAIGIGTTMLLHCDLVFANENCRFQMPFVNLGLCPEAGSTLLLPNLVGHVKASEWLLLGKVFDAKEALEAKLINDKFANSASVYEAAMTAATKIAAQPPQAIRITKAMLKKPYREALQTALMEEGAEFFKLAKSPEAMEAFQAFFQKRKPDFSKFS